MPDPVHTEEIRPLLHAEYATNANLNGLRALTQHGLGLRLESESADPGAYIPEEGGLDSSVLRTVVVVCMLAALDIMIMLTTSPTHLLYMHHVGFTTTNNVSFYVLVTVVSNLVTVAGHTGLGALTTRLGARRAIFFACSVVAMGLAGMILAPPSRTAYIAAHSMYGLYLSMSVIFVVVLTERVPPKHRTGALSVKMMVAPIGGLFGPILWLACERFKGDVQLLDRLRVNMFTLDYMVAIAMVLGMAVLANYFLRAKKPSGRQPIAERSIRAGNRAKMPVDINDRKYVRTTFIYFLVLMLCISVTQGLYLVGVQPILVNKFSSSGQDIGVIFEMISLSCIVPSTLVILLSRFVKDRVILLMGIVANVIGIVLMQPVFSANVYMWQYVAGSIFLVFSQILVMISIASLFSKLLGEMSKGAMLGSLYSLNALGPAAAQLLFAEKTLELFGTFWYALGGAPLLLAAAMTLYPPNWRKLNPEWQCTRSFREENKSLCTDVRQDYS